MAGQPGVAWPSSAGAAPGRHPEPGPRPGRRIGRFPFLMMRQCSTAMAENVAPMPAAAIR